MYDNARPQVEEGYRLIEAAFSPDKMAQLSLLLDEFITVGNKHRQANEMSENEMLEDEE